MDSLSFVIDPQLLAVCGFIVPIVVEFLTRYGVDSRVKQYTATAAVALAVAVQMVIGFRQHTLAVHSAADTWGLAQLILAQFAVARVAVEAGVRAYDIPEAVVGTSMSQVLFPRFGLKLPETLANRRTVAPVVA